MRLPHNDALMIYRSDVLRYPVLARKINYRALRYWQWWGKYDKWRPGDMASLRTNTNADQGQFRPAQVLERADT